MRKLFVLLTAIALLTVGVAPSFAQDQTIVEIAAGNEDFSTLVAAIQAADPAIAEALSGEGEFTVFAPTNDAFAALLDELGITAEELLADTDTLNAVLQYHVVEGAVMSGDIVAALEDADALYPETLGGSRLKVALSEDSESVMVNDATVVSADIEASNGVIHVIDTVLMPPGTITDLVIGAASNEEMPEFTTLLAAVQAAGLVETLSDPDASFTVFAPTDEAFATALDALGMTAEELLADTDTLTSILLYHVVPGEVYSGDIVDMLGDMEEGFDVETVNGASAKVTASDMGVMIDNANVIMTDIVASNGVIHVIDAVILPPAE